MNKVAKSSGFFMRGKIGIRGVSQDPEQVDLGGPLQIWRDPRSWGGDFFGMACWDRRPGKRGQSNRIHGFRFLGFMIPQIHQWFRILTFPVIVADSQLHFDEQFLDGEFVVRPPVSRCCQCLVADVVRAVDLQGSKQALELGFRGGARNLRAFAWG